ncbi:hypothetical protein BOX15_Mlig004854g2, partial [Macrostomum lignano]
HHPSPQQQRRWRRRTHSGGANRGLPPVGAATPRRFAAAVASRPVGEVAAAAGHPDGAVGELRAVAGRLLGLQRRTSVPGGAAEPRALAAGAAARRAGLRRPGCADRRRLERRRPAQSRGARRRRQPAAVPSRRPAAAAVGLWRRAAASGQEAGIPARLHRLHQRHNRPPQRSRGNPWQRASPVPAVASAWRLGLSDLTLNCLPLHHVHGLENCLLAPLQAGGSVLINRSFQPEQVWQQLTGAGAWPGSRCSWRCPPCTAGCWTTWRSGRTRSGQP